MMTMISLVNDVYNLTEIMALEAFVCPVFLAFDFQVRITSGISAVSAVSRHSMGDIN